MDSTWLPVSGHYSKASLPLPRKLREQGTILDGSFYDVVPAVPQGRYELFEYDPVTARISRDAATATIRCSINPLIWVVGYDLPSHPSSPEVRGVWHVFGSWGEPLQLHGMSRDLWGARVFVTAMTRVTVSADSATKR